MRSCARTPVRSRRGGGGGGGGGGGWRGGGGAPGGGGGGGWGGGGGGGGGGRRSRRRARVAGQANRTTSTGRASVVPRRGASLWDSATNTTWRGGPEDPL